MRRRPTPLTEGRAGVLLSVIGAPVTLAGVVFHLLPGPGFPLLVVGTALLITGLVMIAAERGRHR